jgi:fatty acid desaturase
MGFGMQFCRADAKARLEPNGCRDRRNFAPKLAARAFIAVTATRLMSQSYPLPPAVLSDTSRLSAQVRGEIRELNGAKPVAFLRQAVAAWAVISLVTAWAVQASSIWATALAVLIIATRFNILALLVHEQVHFLGLRGRYGDLVANLLAAYPLLGVTVQDYAKVHLSHHKYYFTERDPDFLRKSGPDWTFPMEPRHLAKLFVSDLLGLSFLRLIRGKRVDEGDDLFRRPYPVARWVRPAYFLVVAAVLTYAGIWHLFLLYWLVPLVTVFPVIVRLGAISEHIYGLPGASVPESSPLIVLRWWEKLLLPNLNFTLHVYHHYFPGVAHNNLPKVHEIFRREGLVNEKNVFHGYWAYLTYLQTPREHAYTEA